MCIRQNTQKVVEKPLRIQEIVYTQRHSESHKNKTGSHRIHAKDF